jgi:putative heme-binding domain-containing protein
MQHNLLIVEPGALQEVGQAAEALGASGFAKNFVPDSPKVLVKSKLIQPRTTEIIRFTAPKTPGDYQYLCTFPGHWIIMNGTMTVLPAGDAKIGTVIQGQKTGEPLPPIEELVKLSGDAPNGKLVFERTCTICHKIGEAGVDFGPELTKVATRLQKDKIFQSILEPDTFIDPKFQATNVRLKSGEIVTGLIGEEDDKSLKLKIGGTNVREISKAEIAKRIVQKTSIMPQGLERTMTKQQLIDLVEFLIQQK